MQKNNSEKIYMKSVGWARVAVLPSLPDVIGDGPFVVIFFDWEALFPYILSA
jgi:hypothetical protein